MAGTGTATINFGAAPGTNATSVSVTGQTGISATSHAEAFMMADSTATHNSIEHQLAPIKLTCGVPTAGVGFVIFANTEWRLTGTFQVRWVWAD